MTVQSSVSRISYSGDGATTAFSVNFYFLVNADLRVIVRSSAGVETVQTLGTQYSVTGAGNPNGGTVTFVTAPANGTTVVIVRDPPTTQLTAYNNQDPFPASSHERALDKLTMLIQRREEKLNRAILLKESSSLSSLTYPDPEAGKLLRWNASANGIENAVVTGGGESLPTTADRFLHRNAAGTAFEGLTYAETRTKLSAVSYAPQSLTNEQKAQARENIGAGGDFGIDPLEFGAVYDGITDDRAALAAADEAAVTAGKVLIINGPMRIGSAITVASHQFYAPPGKIVPSANVLVTLSGRPDAGHWQIFDRSEGGAVQFAKGAGTVWAEWWGARAEPSGRTDNNIPIQHAIDACGSVLSSGVMGPAPNGDGNGGTVRFASNNTYLMSGRIHLRNRTILKGNGGFGPELVLNTATWNGDTEMVLSQNGTISQFWCRIEDMIINSSGLATMNRVIYAPAWQESCGLRDVLIRNFDNTALLVDTFYGGSVGFTLKQVQFFPWATPGTFVRAIDVDSPSSVARQRILLEDISFAGITDSAPPGLNMVGVRATGRVDLICRGVFVEGYDIGCLLRTGASLYGDFTGPGNPSVEDLIQADSDFVGRIDCVVLKGSAVRVLRSFKTSPSTLQLNAEPFSRRVVYPVTPTEVFAAGRVSGGAGTPAISNSFGVSSVSKDGTGLYTLVFNTNEFSPGAGSDYRVRVAVQSVNSRTWFVNVANSTGVQLQFKATTNDTAADVGDFDFEIVGRPGY